MLKFTDYHQKDCSLEQGGFKKVNWAIVIPGIFPLQAVFQRIVPQ